MVGIKVSECIPFNKHYREAVFAAGLSVKQHRMKLEITYHIHFFLHFLPPPHHKVITEQVGQCDTSEKVPAQTLSLLQVRRERSHADETPSADSFLPHL